MDKKVIIIIVVLLAVCCCVSTLGIIGFAIVASNSDTSTSGGSVTDTVFPTVEMNTVTSLFDTFDSNTSKWNLGKDDSEFAVSDEYLKDGKMLIDVTAKQAVVVSDELPSQAIKNFDLSIEGKQLSGAQGGDYAVIFRRLNGDNYYLFGVNEAYQEYTLAVKKDGEWVDLIEWKKSSVINQNAVNVIKVSAVESQLTLYINNQQVSTISDSSILEGGAVGVAGELYDATDTALFQFDNLLLTVKD
ncbi:MAG: hypothetical protein WCJ58_00320 [bacterium]